MDKQQIFQTVAGELELGTGQVKKVADFLEDGATVPFLARYRQEATGGLNEEQIRQTRDRLNFYRELEDRKETILETIKDQGKLTDELAEAIRGCMDPNELEDLYRPYKPKRKTRGTKAKEKGLDPLAKRIWEQKTLDGEPEDYAKEFVDEEKDVESVEEALQGARDIVAEWVNESAEVREKLRTEFQKHAAIETEKNPSVEGRTDFEQYYDFHRKTQQLKPHQILAINRGERENMLFVDFEIWDERMLEHVDDMLITNDRSVFTGPLQDAIEEAWKRLIKPSLERELRSQLTDYADEHAIETFAKNLRNLLMQPPLDNKVVLGVDPAYKSGCKVAVVDETGKYLESTTVFPTPPHNQTEKAGQVLNTLIDRHSVDLIAIGNGTASRETEQFVASLIQDRQEQDSDEDLHYLIVDEAGASVYSASKVAREEFPELEAAQRGTISIARRVQDPLAELVKIDPKSIGVGLYQHDVNQKRLAEKLDDVVESCVNKVGVQLNTASASLLTYVSGFSKRVARNVVEQRESEGIFTSRRELKDVIGIGPHRYQQAAGFLRIPESDNPLDNTAIHPESYGVARQICNHLDIEIHNLSDQQKEIEQMVESVDQKKLGEQFNVGLPTLDLIFENLQKPGRDPRESLPRPQLRQDVLKMDDLSVGQKLEGTVRNVVDFGAFVDIGVKEDGLLHISNMRPDGGFVEDPHAIVSVGDIVKVEIKSLDLERGRIGLALTE